LAHGEHQIKNAAIFLIFKGKKDMPHYEFVSEDVDNYTGSQLEVGNFYTSKEEDGRPFYLLSWLGSMQSRIYLEDFSELLITPDQEEGEGLYIKLDAKILLTVVRAD